MLQVKTLGLFRAILNCSRFAQRRFFLCSAIFYEGLCPHASTPTNPRLRMIPLMPTLALALLSLLCSAFVILRVLLSTLPHHRHPLGRRVYSVGFSFFLFDMRPATHFFVKLTSSSRLSSSSLPTADKSYVWLALCDVFAVAVFVWEAFTQWFDSSSGHHRAPALLRVLASALDLLPGFGWHLPSAKRVFSSFRPSSSSTCVVESPFPSAAHTGFSGCPSSSLPACPQSQQICSPTRYQEVSSLVTSCTPPSLRF